MQKLKHRPVGLYVALVVLGIMTVGLWRSGAIRETPHNAYAAPLVTVTATATVGTSITPGALSLTGGTITGATPITLTNNDQLETFTVANNVNDNTGSGAGWALAASMTQFTDTAGHVLSPAATSVTAMAMSDCLGTGIGGTGTATCTLPNTATPTTPGTPTPLGTPVGIPTTGPANPFFGAAVNTGMGGVTITPTLTTILPANAYALTAYTSTLTVSLSTGP